MKYLVDTHVLLWSIGKPDKLSTRAREIIIGSTVFVSIASWWELSLKFAMGKLELENGTPEDLWKAAEQMNYELLQLSGADASSFHRLAKIYKDPFDRMIVWQAIRNNLPLLSKDNRLSGYEEYGLQLLW